jgi:DNA mismatch endonuclease (patch repair protein)
VDGCFWHGCPLCGHIPKSNRRYWSPKLLRNKKRDRSVSQALNRRGWAVVRFWEHEIRENPVLAISRLKQHIS